MTQVEIIEQNKKLASELMRQVNFMGNDENLADALIDEIRSAHRTNQQSIIGVFKKVIECYATTIGTDLRNQDSKQWAKEVAKIQQHGFSFI